MRHGKRYKKAVEQVDRDRLYEPTEAFELLKRVAISKFDETVEIAVRLGVDPRHSDQVVRSAVVLPNGTGKKVRIAVFAKGEKVKEAEEAGADVVGAEDLADRIQQGWLEFDTAVATPDMMALVGRIGRILGPRGLMPNTKTGTITFDLKQAIQEIKSGKVEFRTDKAGVVHAPIGKLSFGIDALNQNLAAFMDAVEKSKPSTAKGTYIKSVSVTSTMGPGVRLNPATIAQALATTA